MRALLRSLLFILLGLSLLLFVGVPALSPLVLPPIVNAQLQYHNLTLGRDTSILLNPLKLSLTIDDLSLEHNNNSILSLQHLSGRIQWASLIDRQLQLEHIEITGINTAIAVSDGNVSLADWHYQATPTTVKTEPANTALKLIINTVRLAQSDIAITVNDAPVQLAINELKLTGLQLDNDNIHGQVALDIRLNNAPIQLTLPFNKTGNNISAEPALAIAALQLNTLASFAPPLVKQLEGELSANVVGTLGYDLNSQALQWQSSDSQLALKNSVIALDDISASWEALHLDGVTVGVAEQPSLSVGAVRLNNYHANARVASGAQLAVYQASGSAILSGLQGSTTQIQAELLQLSNSENHIHLSAAETIATAINTSEAVDNTDTTSTATKTTSPSAYLAALQLGTPATVSIHDQRLATPFKHTLTIEELTLNNLSSVPNNQPASLHSKGKDGNYGSFTINAQMPSRQTPTTFTAALELKSITLDNFAPYLKQSLGLNIETGILNTNLNMAAQNSELSGTTHVLVNQLKVRADAKAVSDGVRVGSALSLNAALRTLSDSDGNLKLKIPISGNLSDPNFSVKHIINQVIKKAAFLKTKDYLITAFVPYANAVKLTEVAGSYLLKIRFEPLYFDLTQNRFNSEQQAQLLSIAHLLTDEKINSITICPVVPAQQQQQSDNASVFAKNVRAYLVEEHAIAPNRVIPCKLRIDDAKAAQPRLQFSS